jgi:hypothetical protein
MRTARKPEQQLDLPPKRNGPLPGEGGAPVKEIDVKNAERLALIQCTDVEMALCLGVSVDTLARRKQQDPEFAETIERGRANGKMSLRRVQWQSAQAGNATMQIWLGKQILGQRDKHEFSGDPDNPLTVRYVVEVPPDPEDENEWQARYAPPTIEHDPVKD